jgi:predicted dinucleotide-binding enzyme
MRIGIIGTGNVGRALSTASMRAGHSVTVASADEKEPTPARFGHRRREGSVEQRRHLEV